MFISFVKENAEDLRPKLVDVNDFETISEPCLPIKDASKRFRTSNEWVVHKTPQKTVLGGGLLD